MIDPALLLLLIPLLILQLGLLAGALWDLTRPGRQVLGGSRLVWGLVIIALSFVGPIVYFLVGRGERVEVAPSQAATGGAIASPPAPGGAVASPAIGGRSVPRGTADADSGVECRSLTKRYGGPSGILALDGLDLVVPAGSVFGLLGPNGAGKTTTLRLLAGLSRPTGGSARVAGVSLSSDGPDLARRIGFLDQDPVYYGWLSGRELVELVGRLHGLRGEPLRHRSEELLVQVGLDEAMDRRVGAYSGGMRQRLGIAQALVNRPPLLILDEPVSSLDPEGRRDLLELIADLRGTSTVLFSTHILADVERICDRVAILDRGRLIVEESLGALLDRYALPAYRLDPEPGQAAAVAALVARLGARPWVSGVDDDHGMLRVRVTEAGRAAHELPVEIAAAGVALVAFQRERPTLEDVFLELVGGLPGEERHRADEGRPR